MTSAVAHKVFCIPVSWMASWMGHHASSPQSNTAENRGDGGSTEVGTPLPRMMHTLQLRTQARGHSPQSSSQEWMTGSGGDGGARSIPRQKKTHRPGAFKELPCKTLAM